MSTLLKLGPVVVALVVLIGIATAATAGNTVPKSRIGSVKQTIGVDNLRPPECQAVHYTTKISGSGTINGTTGNDLILGGPNIDTIDGKGGDDCILGGGGYDDIRGGAGKDICIGGPESARFRTCETEYP